MEYPYEFSAKVELFSQEGGWHYVSVPKTLIAELLDMADRGLIPIRVSYQESTWDTSLLPMGDGTHFIALNKSIRQSEGINLGDKITLRFRPRLD